MKNRPLEPLVRGTLIFKLGNELVDLNEYKGFIRGVARRFAASHPGITLDVDDLYQEGLVAFLQGGGRFNLNRHGQARENKAKFSTFLAKICWWYWQRLTWNEVHRTAETTMLFDTIPSNQVFSSAQLYAKAEWLSSDARAFLDVLFRMPEDFTEGFKRLLQERPRTSLPRLVGVYIDREEKERVEAQRQVYPERNVKPYFKRWHQGLVDEVTEELLTKCS